MKANELRLGNWVNYNEDDAKFKITEICETGIGVTNEIETTWIDLDQFSGIPLTEEILLKAGLEEKVANQKLYACNGVYGYWFDEDNCFRVFVEGTPFIKIKTLHHLQNYVFTVSGTELNINL